ncbi:MAG: DUF4184 family protein [Gammaproteobacteria bacterium]|nr:DUF4184 family protein [Gammaproteobacteria bacterium]MBV9619485.1 DUF4184 family protein [Gammaproteobacteria bacterium]
MPFTLAHPAAVLPLRRLRFLRVTPLIIGAVAPDLPYYLPGNLKAAIPETHEFAHSYSVDLAIGIVTLWVLYVLRRALTALLSARARALILRGLAPYARLSQWPWALAAIVLGVWTHLLWDSFTHPNGFMVRRVAALSAPVTLGPYSGPLYHVLQYLSSVFGLTCMAVWYLALRPPPPRSADPHAARSAVVPILVLIGAAALLIGGVQATVHYRQQPGDVYRTINILLTHGLAWFAALYLVAGALITHEQRSEAALR